MIENISQILVTKEDLAKEVSRIDVKISETKDDLIKWIFAFWITLALMIVGLYLKN
jgi:hypothetical protein